MSQFPAYVAESLHFDTLTGASDSQRLLVIDQRGRHYGPLAKIEPEAGSYRLKVSDLAEGRVIARIWSESSYVKLGLQRGWTWWWVDKHGAPGDTSWRSLYITESGQTTEKPMTLKSYDRHRWRQAIARFLWSDTDEGTWGTCGSACCAS